MREPRTHSPFPGMDPYLEQYWGDVHHALCTYSRDALRKSLPAGLIARMDERTLIEDEVRGHRKQVIPDVRVVERGVIGPFPTAGSLTLAQPLLVEVDYEPIVEGFVQILDPRDGARVVTVVEFTSPVNKNSRDGRKKYLEKQAEVLAGGANLVEIDLIRVGQWIVRVPEDRIVEKQKGLYRVCVSRETNLSQSEFYPIQLNERLPIIRVPLRETDPDVALDLQAIIDLAYENGSYGYDIDYTKPPVPPLAGEDAAFANEQLRSEHPDT